MNKIFLVILVAFLIPILAAKDNLASEYPDPAALRTAEYFLELLDSGETQLAWGQTSMVNQSYSRQPEWFEKATSVRPFLGPLRNRDFKTSSEHQTWTGLPDGDYLRISFWSDFSHKQQCLETVILIREGAAWSINSYFLR